MPVIARQGASRVDAGDVRAAWDLDRDFQRPGKPEVARGPDVVATALQIDELPARCARLAPGAGASA